MNESVRKTLCLSPKIGGNITPGMEGKDRNMQHFRHQKELLLFNTVRKMDPLRHFENSNHSLINSVKVLYVRLGKNTLEFKRK